MPACLGASFSFASRSANCEAAWAPTWAIRKAGEVLPTGREQDSSEFRNVFTQRYYYTVQSFSDRMIILMKRCEDQSGLAA